MWYAAWKVHDVAAIAVQGWCSDVAVQAAEASRITFFRLPDEIPLNQVERSVIRLIVDRAGYIAQRSADLQRELNQVALDGGGLDRIASHLHHFAQQPIVLLGEDGQLSASGGLETWSTHKLADGSHRSTEYHVLAQLGCNPAIHRLRWDRWNAAYGK